MLSHSRSTGVNRTCLFHLWGGAVFPSVWHLHRIISCLGKKRLRSEAQFEVVGDKAGSCHVQSRTHVAYSSPPRCLPKHAYTQIDFTNGDYFLDGPIFIKSGVTLNGGYTDDSPNYPFFRLYDGPNTASTTEDAVIVIDGTADAEVSSQ